MWLQVGRRPRLSRGQRAGTGIRRSSSSSREAESGPPSPGGYAPCIPALGCGSSARGWSLRPRPSCHSPRRADPSSNGRCCCPRDSCLLPGDRRGTLAGGQRLVIRTLFRPGSEGGRAQRATRGGGSGGNDNNNNHRRCGGGSTARGPNVPTPPRPSPPPPSRGACQSVLRRSGREL